MKTLLQCLLCLGLTCCINPDAPDPETEDGALDEIVLAEFSRDTPGIVLFPHHRHAAPEEEGGRGIDCAACHHDYKGPETVPGSCRTCHMYHQHGDAKLPAL